MASSTQAYELEMDKVAMNFLEDLEKEQCRLKEGFPICNLLIDEAYDRIYSTGHVPGHETYVDVMRLKPMKLTQRIVVPARCYPELNLIDKILKLKGNCIKIIEDETQCKILIKGRNSMSDLLKEETLRLSKDPRYMHLNKELFLEVSTETTPIECYTRMAHALAEIRKYLLPETNEGINESQLNPLEHVKIEQFEEPSMDINLKEQSPPQLANQGRAKADKSNPNSISLADKLIKLLDETVLNPNFQYSENETKIVSDHIELLNSFIVSKVSTKTVSHDNNNSSRNFENKSIQPTPSTSASISIENELKMKKKKCENEKLGVSTKQIVKRKLSKDFITSRSVKMKVDKLKALRKKNLENALNNQKQKYPGTFYMKDTETDKIVKRKILNKTSLSHCLKRSKAETEQQNVVVDNDDDKGNNIFTIEYLQQNSTELTFEFTPRDIIITLLENMKSYPVLWEFHNEPHNGEYIKAIEKLCEIIKEKWLLNIEPLKMRRSITRILRFYRFLFPFDNIDKFTEYFGMCANFLPITVIEIPHARCVHCLRCFKRDKELKSHLLADHDKLKWFYKCQHCRESFKTSNEFEFHKRLPHYMEVFTCPKCNKKFYEHKSYKRHSHQLTDLPRSHICDVCQKGFKTKRELTKHKGYHGEKKFKCDQCSCAYYSKSNLTIHLKKHLNELNYICDVCGKAFMQKKHLNEHMETHTGIKVACSICNLKIRRSNLKRHLRTVHVACEGTIENTFRAKTLNYKRGEGTRVFNPNNAKRKRRPAERPRHYDCKVCNIPFDSLKVLMEHNKEFHSDLIQKLPCKMCDGIVSHMGNLKRHYRIKHKLPEYQIFAFVEKDMDVNTVLAMTSDQALVELTT
ncbi:uncharacterized protein ACRADG_009874 isoform 2-T4 [Cochliomyia hominivorax]